MYINDCRSSGPWPPRSPDLTPLDFSIFGHLEHSVFKRRMENLDELMEEITNYCNNIDQEMLQNISETKKRRIKLFAAKWRAFSDVSVNRWT